ncbi:MAG: IclR family transcriptional regulator C-terminal domain-containing protein, partial [Pseudomonadota bacterium]
AHTSHSHVTADTLRDELCQIRRDGVAYDREEHEPGIICIAAPILTQGDRAIGALSVTTSTARKSLDDLACLAPSLQSTARDIARAASSWQFPSQ